MVRRRQRQISVCLAIGVFDLHARLLGDVHHGRVARQAVHIQRGDVRIAAANGGAFKEFRADALAANAFQHGHAELRRALVAFSRQISQVADAGQLQLAVEDAENGVAREVDRADVVFDHMVRHDLAEAQQAVVFVEREEVGKQPFAVDGGEFADQSWRTTGWLRRTIVRDDRLSGAGCNQVHGRVLLLIERRGAPQKQF
ncbi:protein of unknown function [Paraburkholderia dioscoreae]|uniref:Uncharacterized protein n=1 Tax=Paraburkholderia dioscoreae TaxID=2604047 RepID=A0A5Q4Z8P7_9BURK|nr:protein of unknown function [Paraburkholderia dioscoreae]